MILQGTVVPNPACFQGDFVLPSGEEEAAYRGEDRTRPGRNKKKPVAKVPLATLSRV